MDAIIAAKREKPLPKSVKKKKKTADAAKAANIDASNGFTNHLLQFGRILHVFITCIKFRSMVRAVLKIKAIIYPYRRSSGMAARK